MQIKTIVGRNTISSLVFATKMKNLDEFFMNVLNHRSENDRSLGKRKEIDVFGPLFWGFLGFFGDEHFRFSNDMKDWTKIFMRREIAHECG